MNGLLTTHVPKNKRRQTKQTGRKATALDDHVVTKRTATPTEAPKQRVYYGLLSM